MTPQVERRKRKRTTGIEWTEHTWNPFVGCSIHTAGCTNCYAMRQAFRQVEFNAKSVYAGTVTGNRSHPTWTGLIRRGSAATWSKPKKVREPSIFFVNSMSDFFHAGAPDEWRVEALAIMAATPHQYQVLTKRPENIGPFLERTGVAFPPNAWIGATVERGDCVHRIETLRAVPAQIRFLSIEPLIGPLGTLDLDGIHWVITGGESGPKARPMDVEWLREVHEQAAAQHVPAFFKQYGKPENNPLWHDRATRARELAAARMTRVPDWSPAEWVANLDPVGKGGSRIDGREWKEWPAFEVQRSLL